MNEKSISIEFSGVLSERLRIVAKKRGVSIEALAEAYVEDWLSVEYADLVGRKSRRSSMRDGPIAFDAEAREAADRIEADILAIEAEKLKSHVGA
jgi:hypothetical protein